MKKLIAGGLIAALLTGGVYFGSPYYAARSLQSAAAEGNKDKLDAGVDFPAVRENLKSQISAAMMTEMQNDPAMQNNPFAGLGMAMMPAIIDRAVDAYVTPEGIAAMVKGNPAVDQSENQEKNQIESKSEYVSLDRFRIQFRDTKLNKNGPSLLLERRSFLSWKLIKIELPPETFKKK